MYTLNPESYTYRLHHQIDCIIQSIVLHPPSRTKVLFSFDSAGYLDAMRMMKSLEDPSQYDWAIFEIGDWHVCLNMLKYIVQKYQGSGLEEVAYKSGWNTQNMPTNFREMNEYISSAVEAIGIVFAFDYGSKMHEDAAASRTPVPSMSELSDAEVDSFLEWCKSSGGTRRYWSDGFFHDATAFLGLFFSMRFNKWHLRLSSLKAIIHLPFSMGKNTMQDTLRKFLVNLARTHSDDIAVLRKMWTINCAGFLGYNVGKDEGIEFTTNRVLKILCHARDAGRWVKLSKCIQLHEMEFEALMFQLLKNTKCPLSRNASKLKRHRDVVLTATHFLSTQPNLRRSPLTKQSWALHPPMVEKVSVSIRPNLRGNGPPIRVTLDTPHLTSSFQPMEITTSTLDTAPTLVTLSFTIDPNATGNPCPLVTSHMRIGTTAAAANATAAITIMPVLPPVEIMKVAELQAELASLGEKKAGKKEVLQSRLVECRARHSPKNTCEVEGSIGGDATHPPMSQLISFGGKVMPPTQAAAMLNSKQLGRGVFAEYISMHCPAPGQPRATIKRATKKAVATFEYDGRTKVQRKTQAKRDVDAQVDNLTRRAHLDPNPNMYTPFIHLLHPQRCKWIVSSDRVHPQIDCILISIAPSDRLHHQIDCTIRSTASSDRQHHQIDCTIRSIAPVDRLHHQIDCIIKSIAPSDRLHHHIDCNTCSIAPPDRQHN